MKSDYYSRLLRTSCRNFDRTNINKAIKLGGCLEQGFIGACEGHHYELVIEMSALHGRRFGDTGLKKACIKGSVLFFKLVLSKTHALVGSFEDCLYYAKLGNNVEIIGYLQDLGYNTYGKKGYVHAVCKRGNLEEFKKLYTTLQKDNVYMVTMGACSGGHLDIVKMLFESERKELVPECVPQAIMKAVKHNHFNIVKYIIGTCAAPELLYFTYNRMLMDAYSKGDEEMYDYVTSIYNPVHVSDLEVIYSYFGGNINLVKKATNRCEKSIRLIELLQKHVNRVPSNTEVLRYLCEFYGCSLLTYENVNQTSCMDLKLYITCVKYNFNLYNADKMKQLVIDEHSLYAMMVVGVDLPSDVYQIINAFLY